MWYALVAVVAGLVVGILAGGSLRGLAAQGFRAWGLLPAGVVLQVVPDVLSTGQDAAFVLLAASYAFLAAFTVFNLHVVGMAVVFVGLVLNLIPVVANQGMPVRAEAAVAAGIVDWDDIPSVEFDPKHHLETGEDRFTALGDVIPVPPLREVLSFGDLVMAFGIANVLFRMLEARGRHRAGASDDVGTDGTGVAGGSGEDAVVIDLVTHPVERTVPERAAAGRRSG